MNNPNKDKALIESDLRKRVLEAIHKSPMDPADVGPRIGMSKSFVNNTRRRGSLKVAELVVLSNALGIDPLELIFGFSKETCRACRHIEGLALEDKERVSELVQPLINLAVAIATLSRKQ